MLVKLVYDAECRTQNIKKKSFRLDFTWIKDALMMKVLHAVPYGANWSRSRCINNQRAAGVDSRHHRSFVIHDESELMDLVYASEAKNQLNNYAPRFS